MKPTSKHFSYSDVSYRIDNDKYVCINCKLISTNGFPNDNILNNKDEYIQHLKAHKEEGHSIPAHIDNSITGYKRPEYER